MLNASTLIFLSLLLTSFFAEATLSEHFVKINNKSDISKIQNIDFIYLINLDQRPERLSACREAFSAYDFYFHRVPTIFGWNLSSDAIADCGVKFAPNTETQVYETSHNKVQFITSEKFTYLYDPLNPSCYKNTYFHDRLTLGAIGCTLSHLSILQDAYDSGYDTIWILEDDVFVRGNPHQISKYIEELDALISDWDILYTDFAFSFKTISQMEEQGYWRPDVKKSPSELVFTHHFSDNFVKIGCRTHTHSMIFRRSGIEKVLNFVKQHGIFLPYDIEIAFVPTIQLYCLKNNFLDLNPIQISDTMHKNY